MTKVLTHQKDIDALKSRASKYKKQKLSEQQGETDQSTIITGGSSNSFPIIDRISRQEIGENTSALSNIINQLDLPDIH